MKMNKNKYYSSRAAVPKNDRWNLEKMYATVASWEKDFQKVKKSFPGLAKFKGQLKTPAQILECFEQTYAVQRILEKVYVFASHQASVDLSDASSQSLLKKAQEIYNNFAQAVSFISPELVKLPEAELKKMADLNQFKNYRKELEQLIIKKKHILSDLEENLLAQSSRLFTGPNDIFSALDNVDLDYGEVKNPEGKKEKLTSGLYIKFLENPNRKFRQQVFETYYTAYQKHIHTYSEILSLCIKQHDYYAKAKHYSSSLEAALSANLIDTKVYTTLVEQTNQNLQPLHDYFKLRAKKLKLKKLNMWDLRCDLFKTKQLHFSYDEAVKICLEALKPLGEEYCRVLKQGLEGGWVDKYENKGKTSGAYSSGCFDSYPYILLNFTGTLNDVFTLAHEAGHSMHSYYARTTQPYSLSDYTLFTAEMASTTNERLLSEYLLKKYSGEERKSILVHEIDGIRATYYRQTMFAEFELLIHQSVEKGEPLTTDFLNQEYQKLNQKYHGSILAKDDFIQYEWARIPHFYYNFYVYGYATGIAAAYYFSEQILHPKTGKAAAEKYLNFLKSGGNDFPLRQLKAAGLDFTKPEIYQAVAKNLKKCLNLL
jgi:oligoendopeptidase F